MDDQLWKMGLFIVISFAIRVLQTSAGGLCARKMDFGRYHVDGLSFHCVIGIGRAISRIDVDQNPF